MSSLNYHSKVVANVECRHVSAEPMVGRCQLLFDLEFNRTKWDDNHVPLLDSLRLAIALNGTPLGTAFADGADFLFPARPRASNPGSEQRRFRLEIGPQTLNGIERERREQGVLFALEVLGTATVHRLDGGGESEQTSPFLPTPLSVEPLLFDPYLTRAEVTHRVSQSDWIGLLDRMGYTRTLMFEVPWPSGSGSELQEAISYFENARESFLSGNYKGAVAELRDCLDNACSEIDCDKAPWSKVENRESRQSMNMRERFLLAWSSVRHLTHSAHHGGDYSREEAHYILGMGALALSLAANAPGVLRRARDSTGTGRDGGG